MFKKELLEFIRSESNRTHNIRDTKGLKLLKRLRHGVSYLGNYKFRGLLFFDPQPRAPFTFLRPPAQITFSRPLTMKLLFHGPPTSKITFSRPLVTATVCHVFFTPLNKTQPTAYSKIPFSKKPYHT